MTAIPEYFSDREHGPPALNERKVTEAAWNGLAGIIKRRIQKGDFGNSFPEGCIDSPSTCCGTDSIEFHNALRAEVPAWESWECVPDIATLCDTLEFCHHNVAHAESYYHHSYCRHDHFRFDIKSGQSSFRADVNRVLKRNGIALCMTDEGLMQRVFDDPLGEAIIRAKFNTGDDKLDQLLSEARTKFTSPDPQSGQESLERAWDAWERLKTITSNDKRIGASRLLDATASGPLREELEKEAQSLTKIGNSFHIRHSESRQTELSEAAHVDYLFQRIFAMMLLILRMNNMLA